MGLGRSPFRATEDGTLKSARPSSTVNGARPIGTLKSVDQGCKR